VNLGQQSVGSRDYRAPLVYKYYVEYIISVAIPENFLILYISAGGVHLD